MEKKKRIIVSVTNDLATDQRVKKVCAFLHELNYDIVLVGRLLKHSAPITDRPYRVKRFKLWFNNGPLFYANYNIRVFLFLLFNKADMLLSNDLDTLLANAWAKRFSKRKILIYDAHEYFTEVPEIQNKPLVKSIWKWVEKKSIPLVDHFYTVNDSISKLYQKQTKIPVKVVRNISDPKHIELKYSKQELNLPENKKIVIMQGAGINIDRGAEEAVDAIQLVENAILIFVGDGDVIPKLKQIVSDRKLKDKVLFFGKQPYEKLMNYTLHSDLGLSLDKGTNINYQLALPNKIFDYIHASIPVLVSDLPEIKNIVETFHVGSVCKSHLPKEIAKHIESLIFDENLNNQLRINCKKAALELTWKNETKVLASIYG